MVLVRLFDDDWETVIVEGGTSLTQVPTEATNIEIGDSLFRNEEEDHIHMEYMDLTKSLRCSIRSMDYNKFQSITMYKYDARDPDYFALLTSATQSTEKLEIVPNYDPHNMANHDVGLFVCLMNGLLLPDGPKELELRLAGNTMSILQAQLLFRGVAHSSCLEKLGLSLRCEDAEAATDAFVDSLRQNRSLEELMVDGSDFAQVDGIFRAAIQDSKIRNMTLSNGQLDLGVALDVLRSPGCQLRSVVIRSVSMPLGFRDDNLNIINTSVNKIMLCGVQFHSSQFFARICSAFKSVEVFYLDGNHIQDLSPLHTWLVGDNPTLQTLFLGCCNIGERCIIDLFRKLPQMKCIRQMCLFGNPFVETHEWMDVLSNVIQRNTSLENLCFFHSQGSPPERKRSFFSRIEVALSLNRAWRRFRENDNAKNNTKALPSNLWPLVLERASTISYFACNDVTFPRLTSLRPDVVFWLLRERMDWAHLR